MEIQDWIHLYEQFVSTHNEMLTYTLMKTNTEMIEKSLRNIQNDWNGNIFLWLWGVSDLAPDTLLGLTFEIRKKHHYHQ